MFGTESYFETTLARPKYVTSQESIRNLRFGSILKSHDLYYHGLLVETKIVARRRHVIATVLLGSEEIKFCSRCREKYKKLLPNGYQMLHTTEMEGETEKIIRQLGNSCQCLSSLLLQFKLPLPEKK